MATCLGSSSAGSSGGFAPEKWGDGGFGSGLTPESAGVHRPCLPRGLTLPTPSWLDRPMAVSLAALVRCLPETKGRSLEQIEQEVHGRPQQAA
jgi:hypothetical protein